MLLLPVCSYSVLIAAFPLLQNIFEKLTSTLENKFLSSFWEIINLLTIIFYGSFRQLTALAIENKFITYDGQQHKKHPSAESKFPEKGVGIKTFGNRT